jgi:hypothetical protein
MSKRRAAGTNLCLLLATPRLRGRPYAACTIGERRKFRGDPLQRGRLDEAITASQHAAAIYRETDDLHTEGMALDSLGMALRAVGRLDEAITPHLDAAARFRDVGDRRSESMALGNIDQARVGQDGARATLANQGRA